ncbi:DUF4129 domain-containing protein [Thermococcus thermotolerans]|uniref:DUF4129 domain-containing protein n=1 Tax=Thermococcus thermotolerans TaxID=2969672 RepID=UPI003899E874
MRKLAPFLLISMMVLGSGIAVAEGSDYLTAGSNDYGAYLYFDSFLGEFNALFSGILNGGNGTVEMATELYAQLNATYETLITYSSAGIGKNALEIAPDFVQLGSCAFRIASGNELFGEAFGEGNYAGARGAVIGMKVGLRDCRSAIDSISSVTLTGPNGTRLAFDVGELYARLGELELLVERYERLLDQVQVPENFTLSVSNPTPYAYENVTFYGFTLGLEDVRLLINGREYRANVTNGMFHLEVSFKRPGVYQARALALNGTREVFSNTVNVSVGEIPTKILASESVSQGITVEGYLLDYFGEGIPWKRIILSVGNETYYGITDENGSFRFSIGNLSKETNATLTFPGDGIRMESSLVLTLLPAKDRPVIRLFQEGSQVKAGEDVPIRGTVYGPYELSLTVYVDGKPHSSLKARGNFTFVVRLPPGRHEVYVYFSGSDELAPAASNVLVLEAVLIDYTRRFLLFIVSLLTAFVAYRLVTRKKPGSGERKGAVANVHASGEGVPPGGKPDLRRAYRVVYGLLKRVYGLPKSTTPRELLSLLGSEPFAGSLAALTRLHERHVYGRKGLSARDILGAIRHASLVIIGVFVRDEL